MQSFFLKLVQPAKTSDNEQEVQSSDNDLSAGLNLTLLFIDLVSVKDYSWKL